MDGSLRFGPVPERDRVDIPPLSPDEWRAAVLSTVEEYGDGPVADA